MWPVGPGFTARPEGRGEEGTADGVGGPGGAAGSPEAQGSWQQGAGTQHGGQPGATSPGDRGSRWSR